MLLKTSNSDKAYHSTNGKGKARSLNSRIHRKTLRIATKPSVGKGGKRVPAAGKRISLGKNQKNIHASINYPPTTSSSLCDNSNDSGLGFDHHESHHYNSMPQQQHQQVLALSNNYNSYHRTINPASMRYGSSEIASTSSSQKLSYLSAGKKIKHVISKPFSSKVSPPSNLTLKTETEDTCGDDFFSTHVQKKNESQLNNTIKSPSISDLEKHSIASTSSSSLSERSSPATPTEEIGNLESAEENSSLQDQNLTNVSRKGFAQLQIITQPEQQHRARYQTEGSRGAVKDKSGNGFPVVKLNGFNKTTTLQVFIGNDVGRVSPHIFYQACKVSGKNSTPCSETKIDGTMVIEIEMKPENDMTVICDCVGILKERNVDVEHRLGKNHTLAASVTRNKKKSTKCRMIFRAKLDDEEILQVCSNIITCTQPPGVPEICKKSLDSCSVMGGQELFIIGKNFLKDTKVTFVRFDESSHQRQTPKKVWEESVLPDKEYLQQTHLICVVPSYPSAEEVTEPINVQIYVTSSNKKSEAHNFVYVPLKKYRSVPHSPSIEALTNNVAFSTNSNESSSANLLSTLAWNDSQVAENNNSNNNIIMPPPPPLVRKPSFSKNISDACSTNDSIAVAAQLKCEYIDQTLNPNNTSNSPSDIVSTQSTSSAVTLQPSSKEIIFSDSAMIDVTNSYSNTISAMVGQVQVQNLLNEALDLHQIKSEQNDQIQQQQQVNLMPPPSNVMPQSTQDTLNSAQQQQVVENFINMICAQVEVPSSNNEMNHLNSDLILNPTVTNPASTLPENPFSAISNPSNMMSVTSIPMSLETSVIPSSDTSNASLMSNAVSESVAETQAVVQNIIANVAAEILIQQENPTETQSTISNFISSTLEQQTHQISSSQQQQLQDIIAQEVVQELLTPVMIKKEETNGPVQAVQENILNVAPQNNIPSSTQPLPDFNLTTMSENDLINFINPTVFM